jgi:hypothetical protein
LLTRSLSLSPLPPLFWCVVFSLPIGSKPELSQSPESYQTNHNGPVSFRRDKTGTDNTSSTTTSPSPPERFSSIEREVTPLLRLPLVCFYRRPFFVPELPFTKAFPPRSF